MLLVSTQAQNRLQGREQCLLGVPADLPYTVPLLLIPSLFPTLRQKKQCQGAGWGQTPLQRTAANLKYSEVSVSV